jgi:hypothetical protein
MSQEARGVPEDLEQLRQRLNEFRSTHALRSRLPESIVDGGRGVGKAPRDVSDGSSTATGLCRAEEANRES